MTARQDFHAKLKREPVEYTEKGDSVDLGSLEKGDTLAVHISGGTTLVLFVEETFKRRNTEPVMSAVIEADLRLKESRDFREVDKAPGGRTATHIESISPHGGYRMRVEVGKPLRFMLQPDDWNFPSATLAPEGDVDRIIHS